MGQESSGLHEVLMLKDLCNGVGCDIFSGYKKLNLVMGHLFIMPGLCYGDDLLKIGEMGQWVLNME